MKYHPNPDLLLRYSAGSLEPAVAFSVAVHLKLCTSCQAQYAELESLGGDLIESMEDAPIQQKGFDNLMDKLMEQGNQPALELAIDEAINTANEYFDEQSAIASSYLPLLNDLTRSDYSAIGWSKVGSKMARSSIDMLDGQNKIELLKFKPGAKIPQHTHRGNEYTVILDGDYTDEIGTFKRGDFIHMTADNHHQPIAGKQGCICLAVTDAPMKFTGALGPVLNWFTS